MRQNVDFGKKQKPLMIFFQVGLIAVLVVVLFALEFRFEKIIHTYKPGVEIEITDEEAFSFDPVNIIREERSSEKVVAKVEPKPADLSEVEIKKNEVEIEEPEEEEVQEQVAESVEAVVESGKNQSESQNSSVANNMPQKKAPTLLTVEVLPAFPACKGLPRNQQMQCFEEQLRKAVSKNLIYPEDDYSAGRQGVALVEFTINEKGEFSDVKVLENNKRTTATLEMIRAAEKAVKKLKKINPAKQGDAPVKVKYTLPIGFRIQ